MPGPTMIPRQSSGLAFDSPFSRTLTCGRGVCDWGIVFIADRATGGPDAAIAKTSGITLLSTAKWIARLIRTIPLEQPRLSSSGRTLRTCPVDGGALIGWRQIRFGRSEERRV